MALTETTGIDKIEVLPTGHIQVRRATTIFQDGVAVAMTYQRVAYGPNDDVSGEDVMVQAVAQAARTNVAPEDPIPWVPSRIKSRVDFARLFTAGERIAIRAATAENAALADLWEMLQLADSVNLDHPDVTAGMGLLVTATLLTAERRDRILDGLPPA